MSICADMNQDNPEPQRHKRRIRYRGTHPRSFVEKYKEHDPQRFAEDVDKVIARGQTPAGMHRPICVAEILSILDPKPGEIVLDATLGYGGHTQEIVPRLLPCGRLFAVDVDPIELPRTEARLRGLGFGADVLVIRRQNFAGIAGLLPEAGGGFDCILADLGVSSMQLDNPERGFSYKINGPLDLRLNPTRGIPATALLRSLSESAIAELLVTNSDEPHADLIAQAICRRAATINTTTHLADAVRTALKRLPGAQRDEALKKSMQRTFMALRIAVNDEFGALDRFLEALPWCLKPGARVTILSFHSGEDRRVKKAFQGGQRAGVYASVAPDPIRPSAAERHSNPRSACAKLRWAVRSAQAVG
jgi:16S rRNA (cytosine1402-N4)-methyltransferase